MNNITNGAKSGANVIDNGAVTEMKNEPQASIQIYGNDVYLAKTLPCVFDFLVGSDVLVLTQVCRAINIELHTNGYPQECNVCKTQRILEQPTIPTE